MKPLRMNPFGKLLLISKYRDSVSLLCALRAEGSSSSVQEVLKELDLLQYYPTLVHQAIDMAALRHVGGLPRVLCITNLKF